MVAGIAVLVRGMDTTHTHIRKLGKSYKSEVKRILNLLLKSVVIELKFVFSRSRKESIQAVAHKLKMIRHGRYISRAMEVTDFQVGTQVVAAPI